MTRPRRCTQKLVCLSVLTAAPAFAEDRVRLELELDPALGMGPRVRTTVPINRDDTPGQFAHSGTSFRRLIGSAYWGRPYIYWTNGTYTGPTLLGEASRVDRAPLAYALRPSPPSADEIVAEAVSRKDYAAAVAHFALAVDEDHDDAAAQRGLVVSLEGQGRTGEAARRLAEWLERGGVIPLNRGEFLAGAAEARRLQKLAVRYISDSDDPKGELLLATYFVDAGRLEEAARAADRAEEGGAPPAAVAGLRQLIGV